MASISKSKTSISSGTKTTQINLILGTTGDDTINLYDSKYRGFYISTPSIDGGNGKDVIFGRSSAESISGGAGSDWVNGGGGADTLDGGGGTGVDWLSFMRFKYANVTYNAYAGGVTASLTERSFSYDAFGQNTLVVGAALNFENLYGSDGNDILVGDEKGNEINGGAGDDLVVGLAGADQIDGGDGNDTLVGGTWRPGDTVLTPSQMRGVGNDNNVLMGGRGNDLLVSAVGNDWIDGGVGYDIVDYSYLPEGFSVRLNLVSGGVWTQATVFTIDQYGNEVVYEKDWVRNVEGINGGLADDVMAGDPNQSNTISAGPGKDTVIGGNLNDDLDGGQDDDSIDGGAGDDLLRGAGGGNDTFNGGSGIDTLSFQPVPGKTYDPCSGLLIDQRSLVIDLQLGYYSWKQSPDPSLWYGMVTGIENVVGSKCNDQIAGDSGDNVLDGGSGKDVLYGGGGADTLRGGKGSDDWVAFKAVTSGNTPDDHYAGGGGLLAAPSGTSSLLMAAEPLLIEPETSPYNNGVTADLSSFGGWYAYRSADGNWASKTYASRIELSGTEHLLGSAGDDELTGDAGAYVVFAGALSLLGQGDELSLTYNGVTTTVTIGSDPNTLVALQAAIDNEFGQSVLMVDSTNGLDIRIRVADTTRTTGGLTLANTLSAEFVDQASQLTAREVIDSQYSYLTFDKLVAQLSEGDRISFKVGTTSYTLTLGAFTAYGLAGYSEADLKLAIDNALQTAGLSGITADVINGTDLWFRSLAAAPLSAGTLQNCIYSDDTAAGVNNILVGDAGIDQIHAGLGSDTVYGGAADYDGTTDLPGNQIWGGDGSDTFYVGYDFDPVLDDIEGQTGLSEVAGTDVIHDWDDASGGAAGSGSGGRDSLLVSASGTAIIAGQAGKNNWNGNDLVDLRSDDSMTPQWVVDNQGKIVVLTGAGNDSVHGSNGEDWIYAEGGRNFIDLGEGSGDGADRVFITEWSGQYEVTGFDADDALFISKQMLDAFFGATVIGYLPTAGSGYNVLSSSGYSAGVNYLDATGAPISSGQAYSESALFPTSKLVWDAAYKDALGDYYTSNGAWSNYSHYGADVGGTSAVSALAYGYLATANGLAAIPIVGPFLAIPFYVFTGLTIYDAVENTDPHYNATYTLASGFGDYVTEMSAGETVQSNVGEWDEVTLLDFFNIPQDRFARTLEIISTPYDTQYGAPDYDYADAPSANLVSVYNGTETFLFLVYSNDWMIQDNEVRLIAQINGHVTADQLVIYDSSTDPYFNGTTEAPVLAPKVTTVALQSDEDSIAPMAGRLITQDASATIVVTLDKALGDADTLVIRLNGVTVAAQDISVDGTTITISLPDKSDGLYALQVGLANTQGFTSSYSTLIGIDANPIPAADITVQSSLAGLTLGFRQDDPDTPADEAAPVEQARVKLTLSDSSVISVDLGPDNGYGNTLEVTEQTNVRTGTLSITDALDRTTSLADYSITLGTSGGNTFTGESGKVNFLYGFGGNDTITASSTGDFLYGGAGNDNLTGAAGADYLDGEEGADTLVGAASDDVLVGGGGIDSMTGGSGSDSFVWNAQTEFGDVITDFSAVADQLQFKATSLGSEFYTTEQVLDPNGDPIVVELGLDGLYGTADDVYATQDVVKQLQVNQFESGVAAATSATTRFFYTTTGELYFDADGVGGNSAQLVVTLTGAPSLTLDDIVLV